MTEFKLYKRNRTYILMVKDVEVETLENSMMNDCEAIEHFMNSISAYQNLQPYLTVMFDGE